MALSARELALLSNTDVLGYIQAENAKREAQAKAEGWDVWSLTCESFADKFTNVYELELMFARSLFSDVYKSARYSRPRFDYSDLTLAELEAGLGRNGVSAFYVEAVVGIDNEPSKRIAEKVLSSNPEQVTDKFSGQPAYHYVKRIGTKA